MRLRAVDGSTQAEPVADDSVRFKRALPAIVGKAETQAGCDSLDARGEP
jgi:hypothetical protein